MSTTAHLDVDPFFSSEAQEVFVPDVGDGSRVYAVADTFVVKAGAEGTYLGRSRYGALVSWDTPDGSGYRESVTFDAIRNLYR